MDLQMQVKRGFLALGLALVLGGLAVSRPGAPAETGFDPVAPQVLPAALRSERTCSTRLRIDLSASLRVSLPCGRSCAALRGAAQVLHMPVRATAGACQEWRSA